MSIMSEAKLNPVDLIKTIYLGDRACKSILLDSWNNELKIQVDCISRVRGKAWDFYTAEDLENGYLVFEGLKRFSISPSGIIPNDLINDIVAEQSGDEYFIKFSIDAIDSSGQSQESLLEIHCLEMSLKNNSGSQIA